jgi:putative ABC transport system permease protein
MPGALAAIVALIGVATLAHALTTVTRRRRVELAVLRSLGFVRRQVRAVISWQAGVLAIVAVIVGVPLGIAAGQVAWRLFADGLGDVPEPVVPVIALLLVSVAAIAVALVVSAAPAVLAARVSAARGLRGE